MRYSVLLTTFILQLSVLSFFLKINTVYADTESMKVRTLSTFDIEDLMKIKVTSVSKKEEAISNASAAIFVITSNDIRRSGATSIPEALRMVPGLEVAQINSHVWAITARGFNGIFANKLLVLVDGRAVYTPLFGGVYWDVQDTMLEDVDRIEVIRGAGATLWGANAVNGVINVITKSAAQTQGGLLVAGVGSEERESGAVRYGGLLGDDGAWRTYVKGFERDNSVQVDDGENFDGWRAIQGGFRADSKLSENDDVTLQGDGYGGHEDEAGIFPTLSAPFSTVSEKVVPVSGMNILGRWKHVISSTSNTQLQMFFDRVRRDDLLIRNEANTGDIDFQHRFKLFEAHDFVWGLGYRIIADNITPRFAEIVPSTKTYEVLNGFAQDEFSLAKDLTLTLGAKIEHNEFNGSELQPNIRFGWVPVDRHFVWGAISRAVRSSTRASQGVRLDTAAFQTPDSLPAIVRIVGTPEQDLEKLVAYELGYRHKISNQVSLDISSFINTYDDLTNIEPGTPFLETNSNPPHLVFPQIISNNVNARSYGIEVQPTIRATDWWSLQAGYTFLAINIGLDPSSLDQTAKSTEKESPHNQFFIRSLMNLSHAIELDGSLRFVDNVLGREIKPYTELNLRLGWKPKDNLELSILGQNLIHSEHSEFITTIITAAKAAEQRGVFGKITWNF